MKLLFLYGYLFALVLFSPFVYMCISLFWWDQLDFNGWNYIVTFFLYILGGIFWYYLIKQKRKDNLKIYWWEHVVMFTFSFTALTGSVYLLLAGFFGVLLSFIIHGFSFGGV